MRKHRSLLRRTASSLAEGVGAMVIVLLLKNEGDEVGGREKTAMATVISRVVVHLVMELSQGARAAAQRKPAVAAAIGV